MSYRRKSALPKYEPPYMKRRMMKGYSHPNSPHPSQHLTPDHTFDDGSKLSLGGFPATGSYRYSVPHVLQTSTIVQRLLSRCVACNAGYR